MKDINAAIRAAGVVWRPCQVCRIDWPFPLGMFDGKHIAEREWVCTVCANAELARLRREARIGTFGG